MADCLGTLGSVTLPATDHPLIRRVTVCKRPGDHVRLPLHNGDRLGYVMTVGHTQAEAEQAAETFVRAARVTIDEVSVTSATALVPAH